MSLGLQEEVTGYDGRGIRLSCFDEPGMASSGQRSDHADAGLGVVQGHQRLFQPPVPPDLSAFAFLLLLAELFVSCHGQTPSTLYDRRAWDGWRDSPGLSGTRWDKI
jgi:hypothetical protein